MLGEGQHPTRLVRGRVRVRVRVGVRDSHQSET
jgi:hypothetical protein